MCATTVTNDAEKALAEAKLAMIGIAEAQLGGRRGE